MIKPFVQQVIDKYQRRVDKFKKFKNQLKNGTDFLNNSVPELIKQLKSI